MGPCPSAYSTILLCHSQSLCTEMDHSFLSKGFLKKHHSYFTACSRTVAACLLSRLQHSQPVQVPVSKQLKHLQNLHSLLPLKLILHSQNWLKPSEARLGICSLSQWSTHSPPLASGDLLSLSFTAWGPEERRTNICWLRLIWSMPLVLDDVVPSLSPHPCWTLC